MIITLCGSARFEKLFHVWNEVLTLSGHTVFSLAVFPSQKVKGKNWYTWTEKRLLDIAHLGKIRASDAILVLNKFAYIGESTLREIEYAREQGKEIYALESWGKGFGICGMHNERCRKTATKAGAYMIGSPIDTMYPHFRYAYDLLPEAGEFRSTLVERLAPETRFPE